MGWGPMNRSADVLGILSRVLFLRSSRIRSTLLTTSKRLLYAGYVKCLWLRVIRRSSTGCVWHVDQVSPAGVHRFKSPQLSDMSNHLSCDHQHVDNLMTLMMVYV
jgi:hypothetical protein